MSKMYEGYKVMDEMVVDALMDFAKAYFDNFNNYVELELKNQNDMTKLQMDNLRVFQEDVVEMGKIQIDTINVLKENLVEMGKIQLESLDAIKNNQRELNSKFDVLIEQNERMMELLSNNSQNQSTCPECGNQIPNNAKFCIKCGAKF